MAGIEAILNLDEIMQDHQDGRTAQNTQVMAIDENGAGPLCAPISPEFAIAAANDPSYDLTQERTLDVGALNL